MKRSPMRRSSKRNSYARRQRFGDFMVWVKTLTCRVAVCGLDSGSRCDGAVEADHGGQRAFGRKCHDFECIPLCQRHHSERPGVRGPWRDMDRYELRAWLDEQIRIVQRYAVMTSHVSEDDKVALVVYVARKLAANDSNLMALEGNALSYLEAQTSRAVSERVRAELSS